MQEVLYLVEQMFANAKTQEVEFAINDVINIITQEGILKEKEQIMEAWYNGFDELRPFVYHSEEYYNKTYN